MCWKKEGKGNDPQSKDRPFGTAKKGRKKREWINDGGCGQILGPLWAY